MGYIRYRSCYSLIFGSGYLSRRWYGDANSDIGFSERSCRSNCSGYYEHRVV